MRSYRILRSDQGLAQGRPAGLVRCQEQAAAGIARTIGRPVEPGRYSAGLSVQQMARRMVPGIETIVVGELRRAARQRDVFVSGAAIVEGDVDGIRPAGDPAGELAIAEAEAR